jgi:KipI family sensor histidine kinase inhibitor
VKARAAGDAALLVQLDAVVDPEVNARVVAIAEAVRRANIEGVRDVVPTYRSVAVHFNPTRTDVEALEARMATFSGLSAAAAPSSRSVEIPVVYGGEDGPDLADVAARAGLSPAEVIARHAGTAYRVYMLGFLPGFPYMGLVDERIASPRRASPRLRVAAGSVGIAGRQTGVYPSRSPGGWQIIGRTGAHMFDIDRDPPSLVQVGDTVTFIPMPAGSFVPHDEVIERPSGTSGRDRRGATARKVSVLSGGLLTTVQDEGRWGHQAVGVPVSGPLDPVSHRLANLAAGNADDCATLEVTLVGPELRFDAAVRIAVTGADLQASVDGAPVPLGRPIVCVRGSVLRFGERRSGARAYVAFDGGIDVAPVLGSRATHRGVGLGGVAGRGLVEGDELTLGRPTGAPGRPVEPPDAIPAGGARLRVLPGPQSDFFPARARDTLESTRFRITSQSDRMGYRLSGASIPRTGGREMISDATFTGAIQVPPSGDPILLMNDRQTTGGYPQIAVVITADLPSAGQLVPGDWIEFEFCSRADATAALVAQESAVLACSNP